MSNGAADGLLRFDNRVAIITGAGRGLGREYARFLAERGARVVVNNRTAELAHQVVDEITATGGVAVADGHDISQTDGAIGLVDDAVQQYGRVDILVNNAGISGFAEFQETDAAALEAMLDVHVRGSWYVTQRAWPIMMSQGYGRVLMTISSAGLWGQIRSHHYSMCKGALVGLTRSLALDGRPHGIHVNALSPAGFTRMVMDTAQSGDEDLVEAARRQMPAELVAPAAACLVHEDCEATGMLFVSRGSMMARAFMSQTRGFRTEPADYTIESISAHFSDVVDKEDPIPEEAQMEAGARRIAALLGVPAPIPGDPATME